MSDGESIRLTITELEDYAFRIRFDDATLAALDTDEPPPLGAGRGPNPARLLAGAVGNCLGASLLFALRKYRNTPGPIEIDVVADIVRNASGRLRVGRIRADLKLAEPGASHQHLDRLLGAFEDFCIVTESVRDGIPVEVSVADSEGAVLHTSTASA